jgi:putative endonuclease
VAELVDALDSKSSLAQTEWGFDSPLRHSMFIVYILRSLKDNNLYIGMTKNISERLSRHEKGRIPSTRNRRPLALVHTEEYSDRLQARKREKYLKSGPGHRELTQLLLERRVPTSSR